MKIHNFKQNSVTLEFENLYNCIIEKQEGHTPEQHSKEIYYMHLMFLFQKAHK